MTTRSKSSEKGMQIQSIASAASASADKKKRKADDMISLRLLIANAQPQLIVMKIDCKEQLELKDLSAQIEKLKLETETTNKIGDYIGNYLGSGSYGIVTLNPHSVFKILKEQTQKNYESFIREIFITNLLYCLEKKNLQRINPFVPVKSVFWGEFTQETLDRLKREIKDKGEEEYKEKNPIIVYEMDNAGIPLLDYLEIQHKKSCKCDNKLKCYTYTGLEIDIILKLATLLQGLQENQFVHGDLSFSNVMVKDGNIMLIDIGNAFIVIDEQEYICESWGDFGPTCFNDRRDLFRFLTSLCSDPSYVSLKLSTFIDKMQTAEEIDSFTRHVYAYYDEFYYDNFHNPKEKKEKYTNFKPKNVLKMFKLFKEKEEIEKFTKYCNIYMNKFNKENILNPLKLPTITEEIIDDYIKDILTNKDWLHINIDYRKKMYEECRSLLKDSMKKMQEKLLKQQQSYCSVMFKKSSLSKKTPKKSSKKTPKKSSKKSSKKTPKKSSKKTPKKSSKKTPKKSSKKTVNKIST